MERVNRKQGRRPPPHLLPVLLLVTATVAVYYNSLHNEFLFDDLQTIVELKGPGGAGDFGPLLRLLSGQPAYRPIRSASLAFDYALSGLDPWGYHLFNLSYHALSAIFVFLIAMALFGGKRPALLAALLFAVHPIQTDAVTYLSGRRDVLSGLFLLAGFWAFLRYRQTDRRGYLVLVLPLYLLAFFSKESGIILPLLCFSYDVMSHVRIKRRGVGVPLILELWSAVRSAFVQGWRLYLPLVILAGWLAFYVLFLVRGTWQHAYHGGSLWFTLLTEARVVLYYIKLLILPVTLSADYSYNAFPVTTSWTDPRALASVLILGAIGCGLLLCLRTRPTAAFGGAWFFIALLPVSQIIPHHEMMAEHYLYVPSAGFFLTAAGLVDPLLDHPRLAPAVHSAALLTLTLLSLRTIWRNADWKDELTLWSKTVQTAPQAARARNNLGGAYLRHGQFTLAGEQLEAALKIKPDFAFARANLGKLYLDRGDLERAEQELAAALTSKGDEVIPRLWLGTVYARLGRLTEAERQFRLVLSRPPYDAYAYNNLGAVFAKSGRMAEAESAFHEALRRMPNLAEARENLSRLDRFQERNSLAVEPLRSAPR